MRQRTPSNLHFYLPALSPPSPAAANYVYYEVMASKHKKAKRDSVVALNKTMERVLARLSSNSQLPGIASPRKGTAGGKRMLNRGGGGSMLAFPSPAAAAVHEGLAPAPVGGSPESRSADNSASAAASSASTSSQADGARAGHVTSAGPIVGPEALPATADVPLPGAADATSHSAGPHYGHGHHHQQHHPEQSQQHAAGLGAADPQLQAQAQHHEGVPVPVLMSPRNGKHGAQAGGPVTHSHGGARGQKSCCARWYGGVRSVTARFVRAWHTAEGHRKVDILVTLACMLVYTFAILGIFLAPSERNAALATRVQVPFHGAGALGGNPAATSEH